MKKFLVIVGSILVLLALVLVAGALYAIHTTEKELNRRKTDTARENRWKKKRDPGDVRQEDPGPAADVRQDIEDEETVDAQFTVVKDEPVKEKVA